MSSLARNILYWAGRPVDGRLHAYFLVFPDRTSPVDLTSWQSVTRDLANVGEALGCVVLPIAAQPKGAYDVATHQGEFTTTTVYGNRTTYGRALTLDAAAEVVRQEHAALVEYRRRYESDPTFALEEELKTFDWTSHMSDDHRYWAAGEAASRRVQALKEKVDPVVVEALFAKYRP